MFALFVSFLNHDVLMQMIVGFCTEGLLYNAPIAPS